MPGLEWLLLVLLLAEAFVVVLLVGVVRFCLVRWRKNVALPAVLLVLGMLAGWYVQYVDVGFLPGIVRVVVANFLLMYVAICRRYGDADGGNCLQVKDVFALVTAAAVVCSLLANVSQSEALPRDILLYVTMESLAICVECSALILGTRAFGRTGTKLAIQSSVIIAALSSVVFVATLFSDWWILYLSVIVRGVWVMCLLAAFRCFPLDD